jgi:5-methylcytosine-specific restriction endonuclease McrA
MKKLTKRQLQKKATQLRRKEERKNKREIKKSKKQAYKKWALEVKKRDNWTCQVCKKYHKNSDPRAIQSAHILSKENYPQLMLNINNGITLCFACHKNAKISSHLDGFAFTLWLNKNKPKQYKYLKDFIVNNPIIKPISETDRSIRDLEEMEYKKLIDIKRLKDK